MTPAPKWCSPRAWLESPARLITFAGMLAVVVPLWLPFGFHKTGLMEEWTIFHAFDRGQPVVGADIITEGQPNRFFILLLDYLGYLMTPGSFVGVNLIQLLLLVGNGCFLAAIIRKLLPGEPAFAFFVGALSVVHPADTGTFAFRDLPYLQSLFFFLLAVYLLIVHWRHPRWFTLPGALGSLALALGTLEAALPLALAAPAILMVWQRGVSRRLLRVTALWYVVPLCALLTGVLVMLTPGLYQNRLVTHSETLGLGWIPVFFQTFARAYRRHFVESWLEILNSGDAIDPSFVWIAADIALMTAVVGGVLQFRAASRSTASSIGWKHSVLLIGAGLVIMPLGYAMFVLSPPHRVINERVFLHSTMGAALCAIAFYWLVCRWLPAARMMFVLAVASLIGVASFGALEQHRQMHRWSLVEQQFLAGLAENVPVAPGDRLLMIFDDTTQLYETQWTFALSVTPKHLQDAVRYLYHDQNVTAMLCLPHTGDDAGTWYTFGTDGVAISVNRDRTLKHFAYEKVIALRRGPSGELKLLDEVPREYLPPGVTARRSEPVPPGSPPARARTLLVSWPFKMPPVHLSARSSVRMEFDREIQGNGGWWLESQYSKAWMCATTATLDTRLATERSYYDVSFGIAMAMAPDILESLTLRVNDESIPLILDRGAGGAGMFHGVIPQSAVLKNPELTRLTFQVNRVVTPKSLGMNEDTRTLALLFDWLRIRPEAKAR
ncbi:MAG: hypothetical protein U1F71_11555 [Verrucomicrobiaceae bacterium]